MVLGDDHPNSIQLELTTFLRMGMTNHRGYFFTMVISLMKEVDPKFFRPTEVDTLLGDPTLAARELGWSNEVWIDELIQDMLAEDNKVALTERFSRNQ